MISIFNINFLSDALYLLIDSDVMLNCRILKLKIEN